MDTKALRQKVLDLAIKGKLVPQDPNDEPASVLLERIRAQKQQMVKEGKLKAKDIKNDSVIFKGEDNLHYEKFADGTVNCIEDEIPFVIPENWAWCRIQDFAQVKGGKRLPKGLAFSNSITSHGYIRVVDMKNNSIVQDNIKYIDDEVYEKIKNYTISSEDVYVTIAGSIGVVGEIPEICNGMNLTENAAKITSIKINKSFLCLVLQSDFVQKQFRFKTFQVAMPKLALERILTTIIPVPPLDEQKRICETVNQAIFTLKEIENYNNSLSDTIALLKSKILDLAVRGKLVPQDPTDEPASILLDRIRAEKEELIKQGKIKRDKRESIIFKGEDNSYYDEIPDKWAVTSITSIAEVELGKTLDSKHNTQNLYPYLRSVNIKWNGVDLSDLKKMRFDSEEVERYTVRKGDLLVCEGGDVGRCCIWNEKENIFYQNALHRIRFYGNINPYFFLYYFMFLESIGYLKYISNGVTIKHLTKSVLSKIPFLLPPVNEQDRIVDMINNMFRIIDTI